MINYNNPRKTETPAETDTNMAAEDGTAWETKRETKEQKADGHGPLTRTESFVWDGNTTLEITEKLLEGEKLVYILSKDKHTTVKCEALFQSFGREGAHKLANALEGNHSVTTLEVDSCDFGDGGLFFLTEAIGSRQDLTSLSLRGLSTSRSHNVIRSSRTVKRAHANPNILA